MWKKGWEKGEEGWEKGGEEWEKGEDYTLSSPSYIEEEQTPQRKSTKGQTTYLCVRDIDFATFHDFFGFWNYFDGMV